MCRVPLLNLRRLLTEVQSIACVDFSMLANMITALSSFININSNIAKLNTSSCLVETHLTEKSSFLCKNCWIDESASVTKCKNVDNVLLAGHWCSD